MSLVILLHGYGSTANEILSMFEANSAGTSLSFIAIDGYQSCDLFLEKRQWFPLTKLESVLSKNIAEAATQVADEVNKLDCSGPLFFVGHSQGAMIASYIAIAGLVEKCQAICVSAFLPSVEPLQVSPSANLSFIHGEYDDMADLDELETQLSVLKCKGADVSIERVKTGHQLDQKLIQAAINSCCQRV